MAPTDVDDGRPVVVGRHDRSEGGARHGLGDERGDAVRADLHDDPFELVGVLDAGQTVTVRVRERHPDRLAEPRLVAGAQ